MKINKDFYTYHTSFQNVEIGSTFLCGINCSLHMKLPGLLKVQDSTGLNSEVNSIDLEKAYLVYVDMLSPVSVKKHNVVNCKPEYVLKYSTEDNNALV